MDRLRNIRDSELELLRSAKSELEWNEIRDMIIASAGGHYPLDWYPKVIASGLAESVRRLWK